MFSFDLQEDGTYKIHLPDSTVLELGKGVEDTKELRRELAKFSHRIAIREHITRDKAYVPYKNNPDMSLEDLEKLLPLFIEVDPTSEIWQLLTTYAEPAHKEIALLERGLLKVKEELLEMKHEKTKER